MNYIKHLTAFFEKVITDNDLNPTHISLYVALFQYWNINRFQNPISISRDETMRISKISSTATYHKCMKQLHKNGYVQYEPSYNPFRGSLIHLVNFELNLKPTQKKARRNINNSPVNNQDKKQTSTKQVLNKHQTSTKQALIPYINNTNIINNTNDINLFEQTKIQFEKTPLKSEEIKKKKIAQKKKKQTPVLNQVQQFFNEQNYPDIEAQKFFNHYQSNGWLVGGKTEMKDWKAAANNWMLNANKFNNQPQPKHLHIAKSKNYAEPL